MIFAYSNQDFKKHILCYIIVVGIFLSFPLSSTAQRGNGTEVGKVRQDNSLTHKTPDIAPEQDTDRASFTLNIKEIIVPYKMFSIFVMPGEIVDLSTTFDPADQQYRLSSGEGEILHAEADTWRWKAPETPGVYELKIKGPHDTMKLNVFVKEPYNNNRPVLDTYRIGAYQHKPLRNNPYFNVPQGFIRLTPEMNDLKVSPHFTLGDFACKQPGNPKFLLIDERLLLKLEFLLEEVRQQDIQATTFTVMSGYRTPAYNKQIGNTTTYSVHLYGGAADIYIDEDNDGKMDDLNKDGKITVADAQVLFDIIDSMDEISWYQPFLGGLGLYGPKPHRGPFVHVDVRGFKARW